MKRTAFLGATLVAAVFVSCLRVSRERAERDQEVGYASGAGLDVSVEEGRAVVRQLEPGLVRLWASAPTFEVSLERSSGPERWELVVENVMQDVELTAVDAQGQSVAVDLVDEPLPTRKTWRVHLPEGEVRLSLGSPDRDAQRPFRIGLLSDVQRAVTRMQDIVELINQQRDVDWVLGAGDLTSQGSAAELERFQRELRTLNVPYYATLGNHELGENPPAYHDYFGRGNASFIYQGVRFTLLDSASATIDPIVYDWLDGWLAQGRDGVHVVAMHIPPRDPSGTRGGTFASRPESAKLLTRLARGGVDLTLYGHIHSYYAFENGGIPAFISGGGGAIPERWDGYGRHFMLIDLSAADGVVDTRVVRVD